MPPISGRVANRDEFRFSLLAVCQRLEDDINVRFSRMASIVSTAVLVVCATPSTGQFLTEARSFDAFRFNWTLRVATTARSRYRRRGYGLNHWTGADPEAGVLPRPGA